MISEKLQKARDYEDKYKASADSERPLFHVTGGIGWINDPNGFSVFNGEYHLFHQYHPYNTEWGPMHWGHLKTKDFIKWERLPIALAPDMPYDNDGCFSGTALESPDGKHIILYTGVEKREKPEGGIEELQTQCVAVGDGVNYEKYALNPVIDFKQLPEGFSKYDFRDPKIFMENGIYYAAVANRSDDNTGAILLFKSSDACTFEFVRILDRCNSEYGTMWECPDFFPLADKQVLMISPMEMEAVDLEFHNGHGVVAFIGEYDAKQGFKREAVQAVDYGTDFYAPETLRALDGRRILIGWMRNWAMTNLRRPDSKIYGSMTLPRELELRDGRIYQNPVRELADYHINPVKHEDAVVCCKRSFDGVKGRVLDMLVEVKPEGDAAYDWFKLRLGSDERTYAEIRFHAKEDIVTIDRSHCGGRFDVVHERSFRVNPCKGSISFRIVMDKDSVELFVNEGERTATFMMYNDMTADGITFESSEMTKVNITKYDLNV